MQTEKKVAVKPMYAIADLQNTDGSWNFDKILALKDERQDFTKKDGAIERKPLFFCGAIRFVWDEIAKQFEVGINHYRQDGIDQLQIKAHGGCSKEGETPRRALQREAKEETGRFMSPTAPVVYVHVFKYKDDEIMANADRKGKAEHIHVYFMDEVPFENKKVFFKTVNGSDTSKVTKKDESSPIIWTPFTSQLVQTLFRMHYPAFKAAHKNLLTKYQKAGDAEKVAALKKIYFFR